MADIHSCPNCGAHYTEFATGDIPNKVSYEELVETLGHALDLLGEIGTLNIRWGEIHDDAKNNVKVTS